MRFGQRVRERREEQGLYQRKLALMIGMENTKLVSGVN